MVTAPYEPHDVLVCTSRAVVEMVRAVTGAYADYLRERHGGTPGLGLRLEIIPLGVDPERFRPPTPEERAAQRRALQATDDEVIILFVGRLMAHAKAHPVPMFQAVSLAAQATGQRAHLVLAGWGDPAVVRAFRDAGRTFAPNVRLSVVDGTRPETRFAVWHAADVFTSLADNIQETFGLAVIEAMASGLPVVASDWDGYRDLVADGETGYLVPTRMVRGATSESTVRLLLGTIDYDQFLAECNQTVAVDVFTAAEGYARLLGDPALRRRMGTAGRQRVLDRFAWPHVIRAYEDLWRGQEAERQSWMARASGAKKTYAGPARYPAPEDSFAGYPTAVLEWEDRVQAVPGAEQQLATLLGTPLTAYAAEARVQDGRPGRGAGCRGTAVIGRAGCGSRAKRCRSRCRPGRPRVDAQVRTAARGPVRSGDSGRRGRGARPPGAAGRSPGSAGTPGTGPRARTGAARPRPRHPDDPAAETSRPPGGRVHHPGLRRPGAERAVRGHALPQPVGVRAVVAQVAGLPRRRTAPPG
jgi:glycosyltransferase involved in cell wall biosynthesis